jgi:hypothetical protein
VVACWHYHDVLLEVQATIAHNGQRYAVPMSGSESLDHAMFKVSLAAHLLGWGYRWEQIHWEETPPHGPREFRPDLYVEGLGNLPSFWFECGHTDQDKLRTVIAALPEFRVVRVVDYGWFTSFWNGNDSFVVGDKNVRLDEIKDWTERKRLVLQQRERTIPPGAECWAIRGRESSPRIIYAVRRERDGRFTYLDSGEGWSLSSFRYVFNRRVRFQPLIPGIVGSDKWRGRSQAYHSDEE